MAKRYYNLERETKEYLKYCSNNNITPSGSIKSINDSVITQKALGTWRSWTSLLVDSDAAAYIRAVQAADGQALESGVVSAIDAFVKGCKSDGIWTAIKASCILSGARTLTGALVPLVGTAPTNNNFVSGDYNRETGLVGNASTKYLNSNRNNNADGQNDQHGSAYLSTVGNQNQAFLTGGTNAEGTTSLIKETTSPTQFGFRSRSSSFVSFGATLQAGFAGISRSEGTTVNARSNGTTKGFTLSSASPLNANFFVFARNNTNSGGTSPTAYADSRISFYSIGSALTLSSLDSRVSTLISAIDAAIA
jgi:hypothetical protein